jgi:hypothetical protein
MSSPFFLSASLLIMIQLFSFSPGSTPEQQQALILHGIVAPAAEAAVAPAPAEGKKKASKKAAPVEAERARDDDGKFLADDPATPDVDEAWVEADREN